MMFRAKALRQEVQYGLRSAKRRSFTGIFQVVESLSIRSFLVFLSQTIQVFSALQFHSICQSINSDMFRSLHMMYMAASRN